MDKFKAWLQTAVGKAVATIVSLIFIGVAVWAAVSSFGNGTAVDPNSIMYMDVATGKPFRHTNKAGEMCPIVAPSGGETGYPAEACYWTAEGNTKTDPTWVATNEIQGKAGPTFCPECGRLVTVRNPAPVPGMKAPKTKSEIQRMYGTR